MDQNETLTKVLNELERLRATVAEQQQEINALREARSLNEREATDERHVSSNGKVGRRGLLRGAAAGAAAVAAAAVAVGGAEQAHAAPSATGDGFILGQANTADSPTELNCTATSVSAPALSVSAPDGNFRAIGAYSSGGFGVQAYDSAGGVAVDATTVTGVGVQGSVNSSDSGAIGVHGYAPGGYAVIGSSDTGISIWANGTGRIWQQPQGQVGAPTSGAYNAGESIRDANGDLWLCVAGDGSTLGTWARVALVSSGLNGGATAYLSKPIRLLDTRGGDSLAQHNGGGPIGVSVPSGTPYTLAVAGVNWQSVTVPAGAVGAIGNVTVIAGAGGGFLSITPQGAGFSGTATLAYGPNQVVSNSFNTGLSGGALDILIGGSPTDVILDLSAVVA